MFTVAPPSRGARSTTALGTRFLQYTFAPRHVDHQRVPAVADRPLRLRAGERQPRGGAAVRRRQRRGAGRGAAASTPAPGRCISPASRTTSATTSSSPASSQQLCTRTAAPVYCTTAQHFQSYLTTPPVLTQLTTRRGPARRSRSRFRLSKISHVGIVVTAGHHDQVRDQRHLPATASTQFTIPALKHAGTYAIRLAATDLAGQLRPDRRHAADHALTAHPRRRRRRANRLGSR